MLRNESQPRWTDLTPPGWLTQVRLLTRRVAVDAFVNPVLVLNLILALPVYALVRRIVGEGDRFEGAPEVEVLA